MYYNEGVYNYIEDYNEGYDFNFDRNDFLCSF